MFLSLYKCTGTASQERRWREKKTIRRKNERKEKKGRKRREAECINNLHMHVLT